MGRYKKQTEPDQAQGAPEWMVTFSDCMTLLLTFFVLLLSFSSFDEKTYWKSKVIFTGAMHSISPEALLEREAFVAETQIQPMTELDKGSEKKTLEDKVREVSKEDTDPVDFRRQKVFLIASEKVFWGKGAALSSDGRMVLSMLASFLKEASLPNKIVISEGASGEARGENGLGLERSWAVVDYLAEQGLERSRFSISETGTERPGDSEGDLHRGSRTETKRVLEVLLLDRSICN